MEIQNVKVSDLKPYERNAKMHSAEQVDHIANSIKEFGWQQPIVIDKYNIVVIGHGRLLAAQKLGLTEVPCVVADDLSDEQIKAFRLADNRVAELSTWDEDMLTQEILGILSIDLTQFGFKSTALQEAFEEGQEVKRHVCPRCGAEWRE